MPNISVNGISFGYDELGHPANPLIVFTHSLLWDREMFADLVGDLSDSFHIINLDQHGHGESGYRPTFTLEEMAEDFAALLDAFGYGPVHWAGLSMGGMTGMRLALAHPEKIKSLVLMDTSASVEMAERREGYMQLAEAIRAGRAAAVADEVLKFFFAPQTYANRPELIAQYRARLLAERDREGVYQAAVAVFTRGDIADRLTEIAAPSLVIVGEHDIATLPEQSELLVERLPDARLMLIPEAAHMSATERPETVARAMRDFIHAAEEDSKD